MTCGSAIIFIIIYV